MPRPKSATYVTILDGNDPVSLSETSFNKQVEAAKEHNEPAPEAVRRQTFTMYEAENADDILVVCPNEQVAVDLFNRGASLKQLNEIRDLMQSPIAGEDAFESVEGAYDLKDAIARVTERKKLSPMEKVLRALGDLSDIEKKDIVARLLEAQASS
jgi:hypothetical protein